MNISKEITQTHMDAVRNERPHHISGINSVMYVNGVCFGCFINFNGV